MTTSSPAQPPSADAWVAAVHASETDFEPLGAALVIDADHVLTCAHVVMSEEAIREPLWVAFPKAGRSPRRRVASVKTCYSRPVQDLAVLVLAEPVPTGVEAAALRCPKGQDLLGRGWWAFGFPDRDPVGDSTDGQVGASLSYGWVRLDTGSRYLIRPGFSGGGLWSPDYGAVVGIVGQAHANGDGRAITLYQVDLDLSDLKLATLASWSVKAAGEVALTQWGWALAADPEGVRHWRPRARGVSIESERGWRFRGRTAALTRIASWLDRAAPDRRVLVVTGSPGVGKSAVLGRIVTTADAEIRALLPAADTGVRPSVGSVSCAVHVKGKTALEVAEEIARAASARLPEEPDDLAPAIRDALSERAGSRFNVIIDALDEAASPAQARAVIDAVILPLAETCADVGAQVVVGTRRRDDGGDLLGRFGPALDTLDLDAPEYFAEEDLAAYALACLQLTGDERPGNPYSDEALAGPLAARIAAVSGQNFLIAGLIARSHGLHDEQPADPGQLGFGATVDSALAGYLQLLSPVAGLPAAELLTALAFAEAPGLPAGLWRLAVEALYATDVSAGDLARFARSSAANFLVETAGAAAGDPQDPGAGPVYRLFHQALNDSLLRARADLVPRSDDERALTRAFMVLGRTNRWQNAPEYLLRSLPGHAQAAELADELLTDDAYLLGADLRRLIQVGDDANSAAGRRRARLLRLTPQAITAAPTERAALFSVTEALEGLGTSYRDRSWKSRYRSRWAWAAPRTERSTLDGHHGWVWAVCRIPVSGRELLGSTGRDGTVRIWDPQTGEQRAILKGHRCRVSGVCPVTVDGQVLLASAGHDGMIRIWDPQTGGQRAILRGHQGRVWGMCPVTVDGQVLLASAGQDRTVRIWDPQAGEQRILLRGHQRGVNAVCPVTVAGEELLATGGSDGTVRIWDPRSGEQRAILEGHQGRVNGVCPVTVDRQELLASAGNDATVRIWDPHAGAQCAVLECHQGQVDGVCRIRAAGQELLATGGSDRTVRIWDPRSGEQRAVLEGHQGRVNGVCPVTVDGQELLASAGHDGTIRIWDPEVGLQRASPESHHGWVWGLSPITPDGQELLASAGHDGIVRVWDPRSGEQRAILKGHQGRVNGVCPVRIDGQELLASAGHDGTIRIWDPRTGEQRASLEADHHPFYRLCPITVGAQELLASGVNVGTIRIWDPTTGEQRAILEGHQGRVSGVCPVRIDGQELLASAGHDGTIRIWDLTTGRQRSFLEGHQGRVNGVCAVMMNGEALLASGGADRTVRIWDPQAGEQRSILEGHYGAVQGLCPVISDGKEQLASASTDRTVRIWDCQTGACVLSVSTHHVAVAVTWVAESLFVGIAAGILEIDLTT